MDSEFFVNYASRLNKALNGYDWAPVEQLGEAILATWKNKKQLFLCGNGGSAANAVHLANDLIYGVSKKDGIGLRVHALPSNSAILTCLANDEGYDTIYSQQLEVLGNAGDVLIVFSGSGNSPNIVKAIKVAKKLGIKTFAVLGFDGGVCLGLADTSIHFPIDDMQISEDLQQILGHMLMRWLAQKNI
jgi:D-sedoheptulose 7-phosphate isomerase